MCSRPVTFGGGMGITYGLELGLGVVGGVNEEEDSHHW